MAVSYKKRWKLLIDKNMKKKDLCAKAGISPAWVTKVGKNGHVTTEILLKICAALNSQIEILWRLCQTRFCAINNTTLSCLLDNVDDMLYTARH